MTEARIDVLYAVPGSEECVAQRLSTWTGSGTWTGRYVDPGRLDRLVVVQLGTGPLGGPPLTGVPLLEGLGETYAGTAIVVGGPQNMTEQISLSIWDRSVGKIQMPSEGFGVLVAGDDHAAAFVAGAEPLDAEGPCWSYLLTPW